MCPPWFPKRIQRFRMRIRILLFFFVTAPAFAAGPPKTCQGNEARSKAAAKFERGVNKLRASAGAMEKNARETAGLLNGLKVEAMNCEPTFGIELRDAITKQYSPGKDLPTKLIELGQISKAVAQDMAKALEGAKAKYKRLNFCRASDCIEAYGALGGIFAPVTMRSQDSLGELTSLRRRYIAPAEKIFQARKADIEYVLKEPECRRARGLYRNALAGWNKLRSQLSALEAGISEQISLATAVSENRGQPPVCSLAKK